MSDFTESSPVVMEAVELTEKWVEDLSRVFRDHGTPSTDFFFMIYALHSIAHACGDTIGPDRLMDALDAAKAWFDGCNMDEDEWFAGEFAAIIERAFTPRSGNP